MIFMCIPVGAIGANCYIIGDEKNAIVIDPGDEGERIYSIILENNLNISEIVLTHAHFDHIGAVSYLKEKTNAQVSVHEEDSVMMMDKNGNLSHVLWNRDIIAPPADRMLKDKDIINAGSYKFTVIHTPGHSMGSICLYKKGMLISGDTLFKGSIGRYDFGNFDLLMASIKKLSELPPDTKVYPGHGEETTIDNEIKTNPYFRSDIYEI